MPRRKLGMSSLMNGDKPVYSALLEKIEETIVVIDPAHALVNEAKRSSVNELYLIFHYSEKGNKVVGDVVAKFLLQRAWN